MTKQTTIVVIGSLKVKIFSMKDFQFHVSIEDDSLEIIAPDKALFSSPVRKYRKSYCTTPGVGVGVGIGCGSGVNENKTLFFLNPQMDLLYTWYTLCNYRCWSKILLSPIHTPAHDL